MADAEPAHPASPPPPAAAHADVDADADAVSSGGAGAGAGSVDAVDAAVVPEADDAAPVLMLTDKRFRMSFHAGEFTVHGIPVFMEEEYNTGKGTGMVIWDGAVALAKYLEHQYTSGLVGRTVMELGCGTGMVGIVASVLGAKKVILTDLPYALPNTQRNVDRNKLSLKGDVEVRALDWEAPAHDGEPLDFIVASDVVWVEELIEPLVNTLAHLCDASPVPPVVVLGHQTRAKASDDKLMALLADRGFVVEEVPDRKHHPEFTVSGTLHIYTLRRR